MDKEVRTKRINARFAEELNSWSKTGNLPVDGDQDISYYLGLQQERLRERHMQMKLELTPYEAGEEMDTGIVYHLGSSSKYSSFVDSRHLDKKVTFYKDGRRKMEKKTPAVLHTMTTWLNESQVTGEEAHCCPSCGAISTIAKLQDACPYCNSHFVMDDLFPKVSNYYYTEAIHETKKNVASGIVKWMLIGGVLGALIAFFAGGEKSISEKVPSMIALFMLFAIFGYAGWAISNIFSVIAKAAKDAPKLVPLQQARDQITRVMSEMDRTFQYDYFVNQVIATLKTIIFAKDRHNLVVYEGGACPQELDEIVDVTFDNLIKLNGYQVQNGYCLLDLTVHMTDIHDNGSRLFEKKDMFRMMLCKNMMVPSEPGFSIKKVSCKHCGGSFDATNTKNCPYCQTTYDLKNDGWVVTALEIK